MTGFYLGLWLGIGLTAGAVRAYLSPTNLMAGIRIVTSIIAGPLAAWMAVDEVRELREGKRA